MHHPRDDLNFLEEPVGADRAGDVGTQHLEGNFALVLAVVRHVHGCHAAATEDAAKVVALADGARELERDGARHAKNIRSR